MKKSSSDITTLINGKQGEVNLNLRNLKKASLVLRAINHDLRRKILLLIQSTGRMTVTEIYVKLRLEQSVTSQHLAILRTSGAVEAEREGKQMYYNINYERLQHIQNMIDYFTES